MRLSSNNSHLARSTPNFLTPSQDALTQSANNHRPIQTQPMTSTMNPDQFVDQIIDVDLCREAFKLYDKEDSGTIQKTVIPKIILKILLYFKM